MRQMVCTLKDTKQIQKSEEKDRWINMDRTTPIYKDEKEIICMDIMFVLELATKHNEGKPISLYDMASKASTT